MKLYFRLLLFSVIFLGIPVNEIYACLCTPPSIDVSYSRSKHIFLGKVISKNSNGSFQFKVEKRWKGAPDNTIAVFPNEYRDNFHWTSCDSGFSVGQSFLVFALGDSDGWYDNSCLTTNLVTEAQFARNRKILLTFYTNRQLIAASTFLLLITLFALPVRWIKKRRAKRKL